MKISKKAVSIMAAAMAAVMLVTTAPQFVALEAEATSSSEIRKQINALKKQRVDIQKDIDSVKEQYKANEDELTDIVSRKNVIDQEIGLLHAEIMNIDEQISAFNVMIADKQDELDTAEDRLADLEEKNRSRIRTMEEEGEVSYWEVVFQANSFSDLLDRLNMVEEIAASDKRRLQELSDAAQDVSVAQAELTVQKQEVEEVRKEQDAAQEELDGKRKEADDLIAELISKGFELEDLEEKYRQQKQDLQDDIARKEQEYNEAKHAEWLAYMATYTSQAPATQAPNGGNGGGGNVNGHLCVNEIPAVVNESGEPRQKTFFVGDGANTFHGLQGLPGSSRSREKNHHLCGVFPRVLGVKHASQLIRQHGRGEL